MHSGNVLSFLRKKDYVFLKPLGQGACGRTILLRDEIIGSNFVCKKYSPFSEAHRQELFANFLREIKILHELYHNNVVRVFNYYVYPENFSGYILMEHVDGSDVEEYLRSNPENIDDVFLQAVEGFSYLEKSSVLHRDIRPQNILVRADGVLKIIDLGFGKIINDSTDFDKSISLNWWCEPPVDFSFDMYNHATEVYFVGKLFEKMVIDFGLDHFSYKSILARMCHRDPSKRVPSFSDVKSEIGRQQAEEVEFYEQERRAYVSFANCLTTHITKVESGIKYNSDLDFIKKKLDAAYRGCMLEDEFADSSVVIDIFLIGTYWRRMSGFPTRALKDFIELLRSSNIVKQKIIMSNIHNRLNSIKRYEEIEEEDDIPF